MELAATNGKRLFVGAEGSAGYGIARRTVRAPPQFGVSSVSGPGRGVVSATAPGGATHTTPSNPHSVYVPTTAGGDECDATMDVAMITPAPFAVPSQAGVALTAPCATHLRGTKRRRDVAIEATAAGNLQRLVVARRSIASSVAPRPRGVATVGASAGDSAGPTTSVAADSVLAARPRLTPILKSHSACKATGRGSVPAVRHSIVAAKTGRAAVHAACSTPGGNTPSPRVIANSGPGVRFTEDCKEHDGPRLLNSVFDQLVTKYFENKVHECHQLLVRHGTADPAMPRKLVTMCHNLAERIVAAKSGNAAVLPHGGGSVSRLGREHLMSLLVLQGMVTEAACAAEAPAAPMAASPAAGSDQARVSPRSLVTASFADNVARVEDDDDFLLTMDYLSMDDMPTAAAGAASATLTLDWTAMLEESDSDESGSVSQMMAARAYDGIVAGC